jgi:tetratricopeptide (TPR) repeat protein
VPPKPPRVFISYAWEDDDYRLWVKQFATRLRADGVDARLDAWHLEETDNIPAFMNREIRHAERVLVLCSPAYRIKVHATEDGERSTGVGWEAGLLTGQMFVANENKVYAALARGSWSEAAPDFLLGARYDDLSDPKTFEAHYRDLLRRLTGTSEKAPSLGELPAGLEPEPVAPLRGSVPVGVPWPPQMSLGRLPTPGPVFVGREAELARLDAAWDDPVIHVISLVAFGGVGKSALVARWLDHMAAAGWRGAERVFDWSFYSQGTEDRVTSAEPFLDAALSFCGDPDPSAGSPHDRGIRLAGLIRQQRTLLILDGVEPLQYPPGPLAGKLKDPGLAALLKGLAAGNPGLCVVTTREQIADLSAFSQTAPQLSLEELTPDEGMELLRRLGVDGRDSELRAAVEEFGHHALTLTLLGNYLKRAHGGDVRKRREVELEKADERQGGHAFRVIAAYARWLGEGPELAILRLLGLFDRPADEASLAALRAKPAIPGLTESLAGLAPEDWRYAIYTLREHGLLAAAEPREPGTLDAHPLVRVYFEEELEQHQPEAWKEGNRRLYDHLQKAAPEYPDTLEEMQPLFAAVVHACRAGLAEEAFLKVYRLRIQRVQEFYSTTTLGAIGSELTALAGFFDRPWSQPSSYLTTASQGFVLNEAGTRLRAMGRLAEAVEPIQAGLDLAIRIERWKNAATGASNLSELTLTLGDISSAVAFGKQSVELADRSDDAFRKLACRAVWANALEDAGRQEESAAAFREAEAMQAERAPEFLYLFSVPGYHYCDLLLSETEPEDGAGLVELAAYPAAERFQEVLERGEYALRIAEQNRWLLDVALHHLTLGRAHVGLALTASHVEDRHDKWTRAGEHLNRAVDDLRQAGQEDHLPRGLLARAAFRRLASDFTGAATDLTEVLEVAERGPMRLFECDAHLELARLCRDRGELEEARRHLERARQLVKQTGYGRRVREVAYLSRVLQAGGRK